MASDDAIELGSLSNASSTSEETSDVDDAPDKPSTTFTNPTALTKGADPQTSLRNELRNFAEGQAKRIVARVDSGANPKHLYDDEGGGREKQTTLHVLLDAFAESDEDDETKQRSCAECKNPARSRAVGGLRVCLSSLPPT